MHSGRADGLAGPAAKAAIQMPRQSWAVQGAAGKGLYQGNPTARGIPLVPGEPVGGALGQAQSTPDAAVGLFAELFEGHLGIFYQNM